MTVQNPTGPFSEADLPIDADGRIYHLQLKPDQLAPDILLVGDPGRAEFIGAHFLTDLEVAREHRGLVTATGTAVDTGGRTTIVSPARTTVATSGMGTPSLEIVLNELVALNEIDFATRTRKSRFPRLHVIRVGTSGGLQSSTPLGTPIITTYAAGMDNTGLFYEAPPADETCLRLEEELTETIRRAMPPLLPFPGQDSPLCLARRTGRDRCPGHGGRRTRHTGPARPDRIQQRVLRAPGPRRVADLPERAGA